MAHGPDRDGRQAAREREQGHGAARLAARARGDRADRRQSAAPPLHRHRRAGGHAGRRAGADVRRRMFQLWRTGRAHASLRPLGARSGPRQRRRRRPDDAEPAGIHGDLARPCQRRRRRLAHQRQSARRRRSPIASISSRRSTSSSLPSLPPGSARRARFSRAARKSGRTAATISNASMFRSNDSRPSR